MIESSLISRNYGGRGSDVANLIKQTQPRWLSPAGTKTLDSNKWSSWPISLQAKLLNRRYINLSIFFLNKKMLLCQGYCCLSEVKLPGKLHYNFWKGAKLQYNTQQGLFSLHFGSKWTISDAGKRKLKSLCESKRSLLFIGIRVGPVLRTWFLECFSFLSIKVKKVQQGPVYGPFWVCLQI